MNTAIPFPDLSPEIFSISLGGFEFALRWYALAYIVGLLLAWWLVVRLMARSSLWHNSSPPMTKDQVEGLLTWMILGVILGGRLGFVLFYQPAYYLQNPLEILMVWQGGMAFHGGLLGVLVAGYIFARLNNIAALSLGDSVAMAAAPGLFLGRVANFINAELWGHPTDMPWGVIFPGEAAQSCLGPEGLIERAWETFCARHPSQLYEAFLEGVILFAVLLWVVYRRGWLKIPGQTIGLFFVGYGLSRFIVEYFRQPDLQFFANHPRGYAVWLNDSIGLTMGQILSLPMVLLGLALIVFVRRAAQ